MRVLFVASECAPLVKTGGLADVVGSLPAALRALGIEVRILLPAYATLPEVTPAGEAVALGELAGGAARLVPATAAGLDLLLLDAPHLFGRPGNPYLDDAGADWPDNHLRFGALGRAAERIARGALAGWQPDLVHLHDWQAGLAAAFLKLDDGPSPPIVTTIHNIAFQGLFPPTVMADLDLSSKGFTSAGFEYYGQVGFLKAGLAFADRVTTVSPGYARELLTPEFGMGLQGILAARRDVFSGILNGIDTDLWNPETDPALEAAYSPRALKGKARNKAVLEARFGLPYDPDAPLFCIVSRLTHQKGIDLLVEVLPRIVERGGRLVLLGSGDAHFEAAILAATRTWPEAVGAVMGYDEQLSHLIQGGADAILVPSRFEPCGLTQLYGLRYGTLPVVARTGGLGDTVIDANDAADIAGCATGFQFAPATADAFAAAIDRAIDHYRDGRLWQAMMRRAMKHPVGWDRSAETYRALYAGLTGGTG